MQITIAGIYNFSLLCVTGVVKCLWENGKHKCQIEEGYQYNEEAYSYLRMTIPKPRHQEPDIYYCWHDGSEADQINSCFLGSKETGTGKI